MDTTLYSLCIVLHCNGNIILSTLFVFSSLAILRIIGPSALTTDTIPEDTCCGQKLKQKDTWLQPKVTLKGHRPETEDLNEPAYYPATVSKNFVKSHYFSLKGHP